MHFTTEIMLSSWIYFCYDCLTCRVLSFLFTNENHVDDTRSWTKKSQAIRWVVDTMLSSSSSFCCKTDTKSVYLTQRFQLRCRQYQIGYSYTSRSNALCAMMPAFLALLDKLVMIPWPSFFHFRCAAKTLTSDFLAASYKFWRKWFYGNFRRMKLRDVVPVGQSSTSNASGKLVIVPVVRLQAQAWKKWWH